MKSKTTLASLVPEIITTVSRATEAGLDGVMELQAANQPERGGTLSVSRSRVCIAEMMRDMPLIVACCKGQVKGFLMTSTQAMNADTPIIRAMLAVYSGAAGAYIYGPICVSAEERGKGLALTMLMELRRQEPGREGILFIRRDNTASLRAHAKMGMREVAAFVFNGINFAVFSYVG